MSAVNISHHVTQIYQLDVTECWACAIAMMTGRHSHEGANHVRDLAMEANLVVSSVLSSGNVQALARATRLAYHPSPQVTVGNFSSLLRRGPIVIMGTFNHHGAARLHAVTISGLQGDGTPTGTQIKINDPWRGVLTMSFSDFAATRNPPPFLRHADYILSR